MVKEISNSIKGLHVASTLVLKGAQQITMYTHNIMLTGYSRQASSRCIALTVL